MFDEKSSCSIRGYMKFYVWSESYKKKYKKFFIFLCFTFCWGFQIDKSKKKTNKRKKRKKKKKEKNVNLMLILALKSFRAVNSYLTVLIFLFLEKMVAHCKYYSSYI